MEKDKIQNDLEKLTKTKDQAKELLNSGFYYAAADLYERILSENNDDREAHIGILMAKNEMKTEEELIRYYQDLYFIAEPEIKKACEKNDKAIKDMRDKFFIKGYLEEQTILKLCDFDLTYNSYLSEREKQKEKIVELINKDNELCWLKDHGAEEIHEILEVYDRRVEEARKNDRENELRIERTYQNNLADAYDKARVLYKDAVQKKENDLKLLMEECDTSKDKEELEELMIRLEGFEEFPESKSYIDFCKEKIDKLQNRKTEAPSSVEIDELLSAGNNALSGDDFSRAFNAYRDVISISPENELAHLGLLKAQCRIKDTDDLFVYFKDLYNDDRQEFLEACKEDTDHLDEMVRRYTVPDYLEKEEILAAYFFDRTYRSSLNNRIRQKERFIEEYENNPSFLFLKEHGSKNIREKIKSVYDAYDERIRQAKAEDDKQIDEITNAYRRFLYKTYSVVRKKYEDADEKKNQEYRKLLRRIDSADTEIKLYDLIEDLRLFGDYRDSDDQIDRCKEKIERIKEKEKEEQANRKISQLLEEGRTNLNKGKIETAEKYYSDVLLQDRKNPYAYLGLLMIQNGVRNEKELSDYYKNLFADCKTETIEACKEDREHIDKAKELYMIPGYLDNDRIASYYRFDRNFESETSNRINQKRLLEEEFEINPYLSKIMANADDHIDVFYKEITDVYDQRIAEARKKDESRSSSIKEIYDYYLMQSDKAVAELYREKLKEKQADDEKIYQENIAKFNEDLDVDGLEDLVGRFDENYRDSKEYIDKCKKRIRTKQSEDTDESLSSLLKKGKDLLQKGQFDLAKRCFESYIGFDSSNEDAHLGYLMAETKTNTSEELFAYYEKLYSDNGSANRKAIEEKKDHINEIAEKYSIPGMLSKEKIRRQYIYDLTYESQYDNRIRQREQIADKINNEASLTWLCEYGSQEIKKGFADLFYAYDARIRKSEEDDDVQVRRIRSEYEDFVAKKDNEIRSLYLDLIREKNTRQTSRPEKPVKEKTKVVQPEKKVQKETPKQETKKPNRERTALFVSLVAVILIGLFGAFYYSKNLNKLNDYDEALRLAERGDYGAALEIFEKLGDYKESAYYTKEMKYQKAEALYKKGQFYESIALFANLRFNDSDARVNAIEKELIRKAEVGESVYLGTYEQDNDEKNGEEPIEWIVLDKQNGRVLLISRFGLDAQKYSSSFKEVYWQDSSIRSWLNGYFLENAFSKADQNEIVQTTLLSESVSDNENDDSETAESTSELQKTRDMIFLLSQEDLENYYPNKEERRCEATKYVASKGIRTGADSSCNWWLRSSSMKRDLTAQVVSAIDGSIEDFNYEIENVVRPAMWVKNS